MVLPKSRRASISTRSGSGGSGDGIDLTETMRRLQERLLAPRTVTVQVESRTRGRTEPVEVTINPQNPDTVDVLSASGHVYQVNPTDETCTCINHRTRGLRCRHIGAAQMAMGESGDGPSDSPVNREQAIQLLADEDADEAAARSPGVTEYEDYFYSDHPEDFEERLRQFRNEPLPYEYENVLNGNDITFGVELEFVNGDSNAIARDLHALGICSSDRMEGYHSSGAAGKWHLESDGSVTSGTRGGELVSPVLTDSPDTWRTIQKICEVAKRHGAQINQKCGGHVHVGISNLDHARQRWKRFFKTIAGAEESIYRFSGGTEGQIRSGYSHYAMPFAQQAGQASRSRHQFEDLDGLRNMLNSYNRTRYQAVNVSNLVRGTRPTVEFRYFNGSIDPGQIQANVKLAAGIMQASELARTRMPAAEPGAENRKRRGNMIQDMTNGRTATDMARLIDVAFSRKSDKDHILRVLSKNMWR